ncbi:hypothetical protein [Legionella sp. W05-934-2]|jgi:hypothetical protein|uniref:hypothetical protein n=1 Tax=Legionella sp. W05-934-2 TaxID=1198649 RepID=UPI0034631619
MESVIPVEDKAALSRIEQYHQAHYYEQLTDCVACLFGQNFTNMETKVWCEQMRLLYQLNDSFLEEYVNKLQKKDEGGFLQTVLGGTVSFFGGLVNKVQDFLPFSIGRLVFTAPVIDSFKFVSQVSDVVFDFNIKQSITRFLVNQFKFDNNQGQSEAELAVNKSLEANRSLAEKIIDTSQTLSKNLLKLFMFREMLLKGKITNDTKEQSVRESFIKQSGLEKEKKDKIVAIVEVYFIQQLNLLFEQSFKELFEFQQHLIVGEQNDFDRWLGRLFESSESRQVFSRQIQIQFLQATRDFFVQKKNERSILGNHPYLFSIAIGLMVAMLVISIISLFGLGLSTLTLLASGVSAFAIVMTAALLMITKLDSIYYLRNPEQREHIQRNTDILNQNITHINQTIENTKHTAKGELDWLEQFQTINATLFDHKHVIYGYHEAWVREFASRYRHAKVISSDLKEKIVKLIDLSNSQSNKLFDAFTRDKSHTWKEYLTDTKSFLEHPAHQKAINAFELRLKIREQVLHIVSKLRYIPTELSQFYTQTLKGQAADLVYIQQIHRWNELPYQQLCRSAKSLYHNKEASIMEPMRFLGDPDYRKLLQLPTLTNQNNIKPYDISTYLRNSLHFLLSLNQPIKPGLGLDPLRQMFIPTNEYFLYRMMLFRQLAKIYFKDNSPDNQNNRLFIEDFVKRFFNISAKEVFDDILNEAYYLPTNAISPTIEIDGQTYITEQLNYTMQSLTLDIACHQTPLTPHHILSCYSQDYKEAIEAKDPVKLIALNINQNDLSVQQSETFENYINKLINDTQGFIQYLKHNSAPKSYIDCYQFNVIDQLIQLQIDIIVATNKAGANSHNYPLVNLWRRIDDYLSNQPYRIHHHSGLYRLLDLFRQSPKSIYPFLLPKKQMIEYKESIKELLILGETKPQKPSMFASVPVSATTHSEAPKVKIL